MVTDAPRTQLMRRQIVALLVLAGLLVAGLAVAIAWRHDQFTPTAEIYFVTDTAASLAPGTSVRLSGYRIGSVSDVDLQPDLQVRVTLKIRAEQFANLRADAAAQLVKEQLRAPALELLVGTAAAPLPAADPRIGYQRGATLTEMADDLRARLGPILDDVKRVSGMLSGRQQDMQAIIESARSASQQLASAALEMRTLAADARGRIGGIGGDLQVTTGELRQTMVRAGALITEVENGLGPVTRALPGLVQKADRTLNDLQGIVADSRVVSAAAAAELPGMLKSVPPLVDDAKEMVQGARQSWPLRGLTPPPAPALLPIDSHDARALHEPAPQ